MSSIEPVRRPPRHSLDFTPVHGELSMRLWLAAGYFTVSGALSLFTGSVALAISTASELAGPEPGVTTYGIIPSLLLLGSGLGWLWTGRLLRRRERVGGVVAIVTCLAPFAQWLADRSGPAPALSVLGALVIASVWRELA